MNIVYNIHKNKYYNNYNRLNVVFNCYLIQLNVQYFNGNKRSFQSLAQCA